MIRQRYRWKYGRYQVFLKRRTLFFSQKKENNPILSWIYLPYALLAELTYALEPLSFFMVLYLIAQFTNFKMAVGSFLTFCFYTVIQILGATQSYSAEERKLLSILTPLSFILMHALSFVEYLATVRGLFNLPNLVREHRNGATGKSGWNHVSRTRNNSQKSIIVGE